MKRVSAQRVLTHAALGAGFIGAVTFLTAGFSLLGAVSCAVVSGMMLGAARPRRVWSVLASLVCPAVTLVLAHASRALQETENFQFSLLCFGCYWAAFFLTLGVVLLERQNPPSAARSTAATVVKQATAGVEPASTAGAAVPPTACTASAGEIPIEQLQGRWSCQMPGAAEQSQTKVMEIEGGQFVLSVTDASGRSVAVARGRVILEGDVPT